MGTEFRIKNRNGNDLFHYMETSEIDIDRAYEQALTKFVCYRRNINDEFSDLTIQDICRINNKTLLLLKAQLFPIENTDYIKDENNQIKLIDEDGMELLTINRKEVSSNMIEKIATYKQDKIGSTVELLYKIIPEFFDISNMVLGDMDFKIVAYMFREIDTFFRDITQPRNNIIIEDAWID